MVTDQRLTGDLTQTRNDIDDPSGDPDFGHNLHQPQRREGGLLCRFEHGRIPTRERRASFHAAEPMGPFHAMTSAHTPTGSRRV